MTAPRVGEAARGAVTPPPPRAPEDTVDLYVQVEGTVAMLRAASPAGVEWVEEHVDAPDWAYLGPWIACEPRLLQPLMDGAMADGLMVATGDDDEGGRDDGGPPCP